jgi:hypothetical protein
MKENWGGYAAATSQMRRIEASKPFMGEDDHEAIKSTMDFKHGFS